MAGVATSGRAVFPFRWFGCGSVAAGCGENRSPSQGVDSGLRRNDGGKIRMTGKLNRLAEKLNRLIGNAARQVPELDAIARN